MVSTALSYFLTSKPSVVYLDTIEVSHPSFSQVYRKVRNWQTNGGVNVTLENGEVARFDWYPMEITELGDQANLDTGIRIDFGDLGEVLPKELDRLYDTDTTHIKPVVLYRAYRSDDLSAPMVGPLRLEVNSFSFVKTGASFEASAPYLNKTKTGETYNLTRFPSLRGYLK